MLGHDGVQLRVDVAPFAHPAHADEVLAQALLLLSVGELVLGRSIFAVAAPRFNPGPQLENAHELRPFVVEDFVLLVSRLGLLHRPVTRVLAAECRSDDQHLRQGLPVARFDDHAAHARVQRQPRKLTADLGQLVGVVHRAQLAEQGITVGDGLLRRRFEKRKVLHHAQVQRFHAQDHTGQ